MSWKKYLGIGYALSFIVESINMGIGQGNWIGMIYTVILFYGSVILVSYYFTKRNLNNWTHFIGFGLFGLLLEWIIFQENPFQGNIIIVLLINFGMFMHWALVAFAPKMLLTEFKQKKSFVIFYVLAMLAVVIISMGNFSLLIIGNVVVYCILFYWVYKYIQQAKS